LKAESDVPGCQEIGEIGQVMDPMAIRDLVLFLRNPENAQELNGLVQDIRGALNGLSGCSAKVLLAL